MADMNFDFKECVPCSEQSGEPALCSACLNNRDNITQLVGIVNAQANKFKTILSVLQM